VISFSLFLLGEGWGEGLGGSDNYTLTLALSQRERGKELEEL